MSFLLDTNVVSEWVKPEPHPNVVAWLADVDEDRVFLSVATLAEIRRGVELLPIGRRRQRLADWLADDLPSRFEDRILHIDQVVAHAWGELMVRGAALESMDAFFAATAHTHRLTLVTRNVADFQRAGLPLLNPWDPHA